MTASPLKRALLRKDPTFSESDYGFRTFGELLRHLAERNVVELAEGPAKGDPEVSLPEHGDQEVAFALLRSVVADLAGGGGAVALSGLKNQLRRARPDFSEKKLGYRSFLQFCKAAATAARWSCAGARTPTTTSSPPIPPDPPAPRPAPRPLGSATRTYRPPKAGLIRHLRGAKCKIDGERGVIRGAGGPRRGRDGGEVGERRAWGRGQGRVALAWAVAPEPTARPRCRPTRSRTLGSADAADGLGSAVGSGSPVGTGSAVGALQGYVAREGLQYLLDKAEIVRSSPRTNAGQAFMAALKGDWQKPITIDKKKPTKKASITENPHPEDVPKIDWDGIARTWMVASDQQRSDWLAAMPAEAQLFAPKPGQKPRTAFLGKLREIINTEVRAAA